MQVVVVIEAMVAVAVRHELDGYRIGAVAGAVATGGVDATGCCGSRGD